MRLLNDLEIEKKRVLLRTDFDVPLFKGRVADDTRIQTSLPTINRLLERHAEQIIILCHIDRPGGKVVANLKVKPVAERLKSLLPRAAPVIVEENLRFNPGEESNDIEFAKSLATKGDVFVNDAFAVSHRSHASIVSLPKLLPSAIGLHFIKELNALDLVLKSPKRPLIFIIGGAKLETKLPLIEKLVKIADEILVGGKLVQEIGSLCSPQALAGISLARLEPHNQDITLSSAREFAQKIATAGTIVWNGPLGVFEKDEFSLGTKAVAEAVNSAPGYTVIGGGDTEAAATKFNAESGLDHISMGGGAMLQYLADGTLAGLEAIKGGKKW